MRINRLAASLAALFAVASGPANASAFDAAILATPGLLGYFPFTSASQANSVANGYTGTLVNGAAIGGPGSGPPVNDPNSSALVLANGATGTAYATAGGASPLLGGITGAGSVVGWINLASLPSTQGRIFSIAGESQVGNDLDLQINTDNRLAFYTDSGSATIAPTVFTGLDLGQWFFIAATFSANNDRDLYVDGIDVASSAPGGHAANSAPFYQGQSSVFGTRYFDGSLADVALFNVELTGAQVAALYATRLDGVISPIDVPEPASLALLSVGLIGIAAARRRLISGL